MVEPEIIRRLETCQFSLSPRKDVSCLLIYLCEDFNQFFVAQREGECKSCQGAVHTGHVLSNRGVQLRPGCRQTLADTGP